MSTSTPHKSKGDKVTKLFRSPKPAFGLTPARPAAPTTTENDIVLSKTGFQWGSSDAGSIRSVDSTKSRKNQVQDISRTQQTHARSVSSTSTPSSQGNEPHEPPIVSITETNPISEISAGPVVESIHNTPSITSSQMTGPTDDTTQTISLADTEATSVPPAETTSDARGDKTRSRSPSVESVQASEHRSRSPSIKSLSRSSASPSPEDMMHETTSSWDHAGDSSDSPGVQLPEPEPAAEPTPAATTTGSSSAPRFSPSPEPVDFMPTVTASSLPFAFPAGLTVPEGTSGSPPDPRSPLTHRPRRSFSQRGKSDFDLYAKRQPGSSLTRLKLSHRRALSQDSPGTADENKRSLQGIPEFSGTGLKASETFSFTVQPPSTSTAPPVPPSTSRTSSRRTSLPASPKPEHVEDTFGPLRCPSPEHVEVSEDAPKQIEEVLQSGKQDERLLDPESSIVIVPSLADIPLPADEEVVPQVEPAPVAPVIPIAPIIPVVPAVPAIPVVPVAPAVPITSELANPPVCASPPPQARPVFNAPARAPLPCDISSDVEKGPEPAVEKPSLAQDPIIPVAIAAVGAVGAVGAVLRAGSGVPRKDTVPTPPVVPLEPPVREKEKPKPYASSKVKQPSIMDLVELATFRGQLSVVFSWVGDTTWPCVNTTAGLAYLYLTDQTPGLNVSLSKSRGAKRTAFENIVTRTYTLEFTGATRSMNVGEVYTIVSPPPLKTFKPMDSEHDSGPSTHWVDRVFEDAHPLVDTGALLSAEPGSITPSPSAKTPIMISDESESPVEERVPPRNLIVCIDGTSNQYSEKNTNVIELYSHIEKSDTQLTYYNSGVGTYAKPSWRSLSYQKQRLDNAVDLAIAWNLEKVIIGAYRWLSDSYRPGDRIYLFGFSRGAYQVRAIAGMIASVGLMFPGNQEQIPFAYALYADQVVHDGKPNHKEKYLEKCKVSKQKVDTFRRTFSRPAVEIHFLGAWDTVSSVGILRAKLLPFTNQNGHIKYFRHALALDERRVKFIPEYVEHPTNPAADDYRVKEVWFVGTHSDVGGGNARNIHLNRGTETLIWMMHEAEQRGLRFDGGSAGAGVNCMRLKPSLKGIWLAFEILPIPRVTYELGKKIVTSRPHVGRGRKIPHHHRIHYSVLANYQQAGGSRPYKPSARLKPYGSKGKQFDWETVFKEAEDQNLRDIHYPQWEGDHLILEALKVIREAEDRVSSSLPLSDWLDWVRKVNVLVQNAALAKMVWDYGGTRFLRNIMYSEQPEIAEYIIRAVFGLRSETTDEELPPDVARAKVLQNLTAFLSIRLKKEIPQCEANAAIERALDAISWISCGNGDSLSSHTRHTIQKIINLTHLNDSCIGPALRTLVELSKDRA
ncbi:hypothetical protein RhiLY_05858 [Ceratobasidium sp. AG-Ba]|nr:hypothetical protein RhiLY_05858 [Ceratobasidium sp. AG-Ba]